MFCMFYCCIFSIKLDLFEATGFITIVKSTLAQYIIIHHCKIFFITQRPML